MAPISPGDAEVALRSFPRRWRALLGSLDVDDPDTVAILEHPGPSGDSAVALARKAGAALEVGARHLHEAVTRDDPSLDPDPAPPPAPGADTVAAALRRIEAAAPALADAVTRVAAGDLDRQAQRGTSTVSVRQIIADAVDEVARLLREADRAIAAGRARSR